MCPCYRLRPECQCLKSPKVSIPVSTHNRENETKLKIEDFPWTPRRTEDMRKLITLKSGETGSSSLCGDLLTWARNSWARTGRDAEKLFWWTAGVWTWTRWKAKTLPCSPHSVVVGMCIIIRTVCTTKCTYCSFFYTTCLLLGHWEPH